MKLLDSLRKTLFWDVDMQKLDPQENAPLIIGRVLDFGNLKEWQIIKRWYGEAEIARVARTHTFADPRSMHFWSRILSVSLEELTCTKKPLRKTPNAFLKR